MLVVLELGEWCGVCRGEWVRGVVGGSGCGVGGVLELLGGLSGAGLGLARLCVNSIYCRGRLRGGTARNMSGTCWESLSNRLVSYIYVGGHVLS